MTLPVKGSEEKLALSMAEAARLYGVSRKLMRRELERGTIPHRRLGARIVISRCALEDFINSGGKK